MKRTILSLVTAAALAAGSLTVPTVAGAQTLTMTQIYDAKLNTYGVSDVGTGDSMAVLVRDAGSEVASEEILKFDSPYPLNYYQTYGRFTYVSAEPRAIYPAEFFVNIQVKVTYKDGTTDLVTGLFPIKVLPTLVSGNPTPTTTAPTTTVSTPITTTVRQTVTSTATTTVNNTVTVPTTVVEPTTIVKPTTIVNTTTVPTTINHTTTVPTTVVKTTTVNNTVTVPTTVVEPTTIVNTTTQQVPTTVTKAPTTVTVSAEPTTTTVTKTVTAKPVAEEPSDAGSSNGGLLAFILGLGAIGGVLAALFPFVQQYLPR